MVYVDRTRVTATPRDADSGEGAPLPLTGCILLPSKNVAQNCIISARNL